MTVEKPLAPTTKACLTGRITGHANLPSDQRVYCSAKRSGHETLGKKWTRLMRRWSASRSNCEPWVFSISPELGQEEVVSRLAAFMATGAEMEAVEIDESFSRTLENLCWVRILRGIYNWGDACIWERIPFQREVSGLQDELNIDYEEMSVACRNAIRPRRIQVSKEVFERLQSLDTDFSYSVEDYDED